MTRRVLRPNQKVALEYCMRVQHPALFMEMRLGKSLVTVRAQKLFQSKRVLIVGPYSTFYGWLKEIQLENESLHGVTILEGTKEERQQALICGWDAGHKWFILNKEGHMVVPEVADMSWDSVVLDESTCIKAQGTQISQFFMSNFREVHHRFILTGTPAPESEIDYYQQIKFLDERIFEERDYWQFKKNNFGFIDFKLLLSPRGSRYIPQRLSKYCLFQTRHDWELGGAKIYRRRYVQFSAQAKETYKTMGKEFLLEYGGEIKDSTVYSITKATWMRKLCGGFVGDDFVYDGKLTELIYLLKTELKDQQVIIWARYTQEINLLSDKLEALGFTCGTVYGKISQRERRIIYENFQNGSFKILVAQPEVFKYGTNLSCASVMIYYSTPEGLETRQQSEDRTIDVSVTDSALIIDLVVQDTCDEDILESLVNKEGKQAMMRRIVQRIQHENSKMAQ